MEITDYHQALDSVKDVRPPAAGKRRWTAQRAATPLALTRSRFWPGGVILASGMSIIIATRVRKESSGMADSFISASEELYCIRAEFHVGRLPCVDRRMLERMTQMEKCGRTLPKALFFVLLVLLAWMQCGEGSVFAQDQVARIGVLARRGTGQCLQSWAPTAQYLSSRIPGYRFEIVPLDFDQVSEAVERARIDFIVLNSSLYVQMQALYGVSRMATMQSMESGLSSDSFGGVIFSRADRQNIDYVADLKGKSFAAVDESSFGGWQAAWRELKAGGIDPRRDFSGLYFLGAHDDVVYAVRDGKADAGTVATSILERMSREGKISLDSFKIINERKFADFPFLLSTRLYPEWAFAKLSHTQNRLGEKVCIALLSMEPGSEPARSANCAGWTIPLDYRSVEDCLKELRIGIYKDFGKATPRDALDRYRWWILAGVLLVAALACFLVGIARLNRRLAASKESLESEISEREKTEGALRESEERIRALFNATTDSAFLLDAHGRILALNYVAARRRGTSVEALIGKSLYDYLPQEVVGVRREKIEEVLATGASVSFDEERGGRFFALRIFPVFDQEGKVVQLASFSRDISERKAAERQLRERESLFRMLTEKAPMGISLMRSDLTFEYFNPRFTEIMGYTIEDLPDKQSWFEKACPDPSERETCIRNWERDLEDGDAGRVHEYALTVRCKGGKEKIVKFCSFVMEDRKHLVTYQDITKQSKLESQVRQSQKLQSIGTLAGGIAHDFNNILTPIMGYAELALDQAEKGSQLRVNLERVQQCSERARELVKQILAFSRHAEESRHPVQISALVKECLQFLKAALPATIEQRITVAEDSRSCAVMADATQIYQIIMNLCTNAAHSMREKGGVLEIDLSISDLDGDFADRHPGIEPGPHLKLSVSDTGCGIPRHMLNRIFDPYFTTKGQGEGTGLGLAVVYGIVQSHGGAITVYSEPGSGTIFNVFLPRNETHAPSEAVAAAPIPRGSERILFVDDEPFISEMAMQTLTNLGYEVTVKGASADALQTFSSRPDHFDLVITDLTMPGMTGVELAERLFAERPGLPVILCTGFCEPATREKALSTGIKELVMKPLVRRDLAEAIRRALGR